MSSIDKVVLDLDGTLVDSVYVHVLAWHEAFRDVGLQVPAVRLHHLIGMGGDHLVTAAAGGLAEHSLGDEVRSRHQHHLDRFFPAITPVAGASELLESLRQHGVETALATSGDDDLTDRLLELVPDVRRLLDRVVTGSDADASKPDGALVEMALGATDPARALVIGDAVWDVHSGRDAGVRCLAVLSGGISRSELVDAGAVAVVEDVSVVAQHLHETGELPGTELRHP